MGSRIKTLIVYLPGDRKASIASLAVNGILP